MTVSAFTGAPDGPPPSGALPRRCWHQMNHRRPPRSLLVRTLCPATAGLIGLPARRGLLPLHVLKELNLLQRRVGLLLPDPGRPLSSAVTFKLQGLGFHSVSARRRRGCMHRVIRLVRLVRLTAVTRGSSTAAAAAGVVSAAAAAAAAAVVAKSAGLAGSRPPPPQSCPRRRRCRSRLGAVARTWTASDASFIAAAVRRPAAAAVPAVVPVAVAVSLQAVSACIKKVCT